MEEYSKEQVYNASLEYFKGDELAADVFTNKYALKKGSSYVESSPDQMHKRLAREFHRIESKYDNPMSEGEIYELFADFKKIVPQGSPMSGIGNNERVVSLSNCFVIDSPKDSYGSIMRADQEQVQIMKRRGGVGFDLSNIRPFGTPVKNAANTSTGPVSYMKRYSNTTREVAQDGRRGALMLTIDIGHPDSPDFMDAKLDRKEITGANISLKVGDDFMRAVENNERYDLKWPVHSEEPKVVKKVFAGKIWDKIIRNAWESAEPGVLFFDTIKKESLPDCYADIGYETVSTNPCGELPLSPYDSCRLLAVNLLTYVINPFEKDAYFDFECFSKDVRKAQKLMDDLVDLELEKINLIMEKVESDPEDEEDKGVELNIWRKIHEATANGRRTGLGVTGEGDMLAAMGLRYGTKEATSFSESVHRSLAVAAYASTAEMARDRGAFKHYDASRENDNPFLKRVMEHMESGDRDNVLKYGRRNMALLTIAPTGSTSIMTQTTSGIEPAFMVSYKRKRKVNKEDDGVRVDYLDENGDMWQEYNVFHHGFLRWLEVNGYDVNAVREMKEAEISEIVALSPYGGATSDSVDYMEKVRMQGMVQKWVDHSISVTINMPEKVSEDTVKDLYFHAWKYGCKGVTVYREGSRDSVLSSNKKEEKNLIRSIRENQPPKRPKTLECEVIRFWNQREKWIGFLGKLENKPFEIFTGRASEFPIPKNVENGEISKVKDNGHGSRYDFMYVDKNGDLKVVKGLNRVFHMEFWNYAKMTSGLLQYGMPVVNVAELLKSLNLDGDDISSWKSGVVRMFKKYVENGTKSKQTCDQCGEKNLVYQEGCLTCMNCGFSKCE